MPPRRSTAEGCTHTRFSDREQERRRGRTAKNAHRVGAGPVPTVLESKCPPGNAVKYDLPPRSGSTDSGRAQAAGIGWLVDSAPARKRCVRRVCTRFGDVDQNEHDRDTRLRYSSSTGRIRISKHTPTRVIEQRRQARDRAIVTMSDSKSDVRALPGLEASGRRSKLRHAPGAVAIRRPVICAFTTSTCPRIRYKEFKQNKVWRVAEGHAPSAPHYAFSRALRPARSLDDPLGEWDNGEQANTSMRAEPEHTHRDTGTSTSSARGPHCVLFRVVW